MNMLKHSYMLDCLTNSQIPREVWVYQKGRKKTLDFRSLLGLCHLAALPVAKMNLLQKKNKQKTKTPFPLSPQKIKFSTLNILAKLFMASKIIPVFPFHYISFFIKIIQFIMRWWAEQLGISEILCKLSYFFSHCMSLRRVTVYTYTHCLKSLVMQLQNGRRQPVIFCLHFSQMLGLCQ